MIPNGYEGIGAPNAPYETDCGSGTVVPQPQSALYHSHAGLLDCFSLSTPRHIRRWHAARGGVDMLCQMDTLHGAHFSRSTLYTEFTRFRSAKRCARLSAWWISCDHSLPLNGDCKPTTSRSWASDQTMRMAGSDNQYYTDIHASFVTFS